MNPVNETGTYCSKSPVPNSGGHINEVFSFYVKVFEPAGNITTGSRSAVLSRWSQ